jgi:hypothetical protein
MEKELPKHMRTAKNPRCAKSRVWCTESDPTIRRRKRQKHLTSKRNRNRNRGSQIDFEEKYRDREFESLYQSRKEFKEQSYHEINRLIRGKDSSFRQRPCP